LFDRGGDDPPSQRVAKSFGFGKRQERVRVHQPMHRVLPPDERFHPDAPAATEVNLRLIVQNHLARGDGRAQRLHRVRLV